ncbi:MAG: DUF3996 domain-containing protein [Spirochaetaceae bacterium]|jgi:hypothetical protein|nr:DUF3996 domain-containing protein [Spirochaetaceae bacterium]
MKKLVLGVALAVMLATGTVFADHPGGWGIGVEWRGNLYSNNLRGGAVSLKIPGIPVFWGINLGFGKNYFGIGVTGDFYVLDKTISGPFGFYVGIGGYFDFYSWKWSGNKDYSYTVLGIGARVPIGLSIQPISWFEVFIDIAPSLGLGIDFEGKKDGVVYHKGNVGFGFGLPLEIGLRFWF